MSRVQGTVEHGVGNRVEGSADSGLARSVGAEAAVRRWGALMATALAMGVMSTGRAAAEDTPFGTYGRWHPVKDTKNQASNAVLLKDGRVLSICRTKVDSWRYDDPIERPDTTLLSFDYTTDNPELAGHITETTWEALLANNILPGTPSVDVQEPESEYNLFCSGHCQTRTGLVAFFGGTRDPYPTNPPFIAAHNRVVMFDPDLADPQVPAQSPWIRCDDMNSPELALLRVDRYYPTATTLSDGKILVTSGNTRDDYTQYADYPVIFDPGQRGVAYGEPQWSTVMQPFPDATPTNPMPTYPFMFLRAGEGDVFYAASAQSSATHTFRLDPMDAAWAEFPTTPIDPPPPPDPYAFCKFKAVSAVTYFRRDGANWFQYVLRAGGDHDPYGGAGHVFLGQDVEQIAIMSMPNPEWGILGGQLTVPRDEFHMVPLPDGRVVVLGGNVPAVRSVVCPTPPLDCDRITGDPCWVYADRLDECYPGVYQAEWALPNASNAQWDALATAPDTTNPDRRERWAHHGAALLLPDARVWVGGSEYIHADDSEEEMVITKKCQLFSPPYLYEEGPNGDKATRPKIASAPAFMFPGGLTYDITLDTSTGYDASSIVAVSLVRLGAATHGFDQDTRYVPVKKLAYNPSFPARVRIQSPPSNHIVPPGYYMLFVLRQRAGSDPTMMVPSIAKMVRIDTVAQLPPPPPGP